MVRVQGLPLFVCASPMRRRTSASLEQTVESKHGTLAYHHVGNHSRSLHFGRLSNLLWVCEDCFIHVAGDPLQWFWFIFCHEERIVYLSTTLVLRMDTACQKNNKTMI